MADKVAEPIDGDARHYQASMFAALADPNAGHSAADLRIYERVTLERPSAVLTGGEAKTWDEVIVAAGGLRADSERLRDSGGKRMAQWKSHPFRSDQLRLQWSDLLRLALFGRLTLSRPVVTLQRWPLTSRTNGSGASE